MSNNCMCGHTEGEHGHDPDYPGSSACTIENCECVCFDPDYEQDDCSVPSANLQSK